MYFLQRELTPQLIVDNDREEKVPVHFDITLPYSSCPITTVDVLTKSGELMIDIEKNITKTRIHHDGTPLTVDEIEAIQKQIPEQKNLNVCGSCHGADSPKRKCCYTCDDVLEAYREKGWKADITKFEQCRNSQKLSLARLTHDEGCRVVGDLLLNKIGGNFHVAPGTSDHSWGGHHHNLEWTGRTQIDLSHKWNSITFGDGGKTFSAEKTDKEKNAMFQYYLTLIPTKRNFLNGTTFFYDFAVNENVRSGYGEGEPGVFVYYDISPMIIEVNESNP